MLTATPSQPLQTAQKLEAIFAAFQKISAKLHGIDVGAHCRQIWLDRFNLREGQRQKIRVFSHGDLGCVGRQHVLVARSRRWEGGSSKEPSQIPLDVFPRVHFDIFRCVATLIRDN